MVVVSQTPRSFSSSPTIPHHHKFDRDRVASPMRPLWKNDSSNDRAPTPRPWSDCRSGHRCRECPTEKLPLYHDIKTEKPPADERRAPRGRSVFDSLIRVCLACGITSIQLWLHGQLLASTVGRNASLFKLMVELLTTNYPVRSSPRFSSFPCANTSSLKVCDASRLEPPRSLPTYLRDLYSCESLILLNLGLIIFYWAMVVDLFWVGRWRHKYLPWAFWVAAAGLLLATPLVRDLAVLFLDAAPLIWNFCMLSCLVCDIVFSTCGRGAGRQGSS